MTSLECLCKRQIHALKWRLGCDYMIVVVPYACVFPFKVLVLGCLNCFIFEEINKQHFIDSKVLLWEYTQHWKINCLLAKVCIFLPSSNQGDNFFFLWDSFFIALYSLLSESVKGVFETVCPLYPLVDSRFILGANQSNTIFIYVSDAWVLAHWRYVPKVP